MQKIENGIPQSGLGLIKSETIPGSGVEKKNENFSIIGNNKFNKNLIKNGLEEPISLKDHDINQNGNIVVKIECCNIECNIF